MPKKSTNLQWLKDIKTKIEKVYRSPRDEEDEADHDHHHVCLLSPGNLPGSTECSEAPGGMMWGYGYLNIGVEESKKETW